MTIKEIEKKAILEFFEKLDLDTLKPVAKAISMFVRATDGKEIEPEDAITKLVNVKDITERSRFSTYPLLAKNVYLRLIARYAPNEAASCEDWAEIEAKALTSYKGKSREEYVDMTKAQTMPPEQQMFFGEKTTEEKSVKRHFWQRKPKQEEESEFTYA